MSGKRLLITRLFNNRFVSCFLINFYLLSPNTAHFDNIIILPFIAPETFKIIFFVFFPHFRQ